MKPGKLALDDVEWFGFRAPDGYVVAGFIRGVVGGHIDRLQVPGSFEKIVKYCNSIKGQMRFKMSKRGQRMDQK